jgi:predicted thioesterase
MGQLFQQTIMQTFFATTKMIGLMELAAVRLLDKIQDTNQLSVGVDINVKHLYEMA